MRSTFSKSCSSAIGVKASSRLFTCNPTVAKIDSRLSVYIGSESVNSATASDTSPRVIATVSVAQTHGANP